MALAIVTLVIMKRVKDRNKTHSEELSSHCYQNALNMVARHTHSTELAIMNSYILLAECFLPKDRKFQALLYDGLL